MKILIATTQAPFITGGAELHAENLKKALIKYGHEAEIVTIPFREYPLEKIKDHIVASRLLDLSTTGAGKIDLCIGLKFPAYLMPHPNKVLWILHQHRAAYDLYNTQYSDIKNNAEGNRIRQIIMNADTNYIKEAKRVYANSQNVANRLKKFNGIDSKPLYHPCPDIEKFYTGNFENYILMPSRVNSTKRQMLAIEAMRYVKTDFKLYIIGKADNIHDRDKMLSTINKYKLQDKIKYFDFVEQSEKFKLYANARAILFIPVDEDYGYITIEAMASGKAVITAKDSGGPLEFIVNNENGYVAEADAKTIAEKMDTFIMDENIAMEMGKKSKNKLQEMNINWEYVVKELTKK